MRPGSGSTSNSRGERMKRETPTSPCESSTVSLAPSKRATPGQVNRPRQTTASSPFAEIWPSVAGHWCASVGRANQLRVWAGRSSHTMSAGGRSSRRTKGRLPKGSFVLVCQTAIQRTSRDWPSLRVRHWPPRSRTSRMIFISPARVAVTSRSFSQLKKTHASKQKPKYAKPSSQLTRPKPARINPATAMAQPRLVSMG